MGDAYQLLNPPVPITCFAFHKDRTQLAISPNNNEVQIYSKTGDSWNLTHTLKEHDKLVTGIDWAPNTNRIVSCSQDRNAYVWTWDEKDKKWNPVLVLLRINRAATQVKWSPNEDKFAVASGHRCIAVCSFDKENNWWVSKHIRKPIRSTVLSIDWHPNNVLISAGCADFKARVFSGYIKEVDKKPGSCSWGSKFPFGELLGEFSDANAGWVHDVAFSPDGESIAYVTHGSTFAVVTGGGSPQTLSLSGLPLRAVLWLNATSIVAVGHENQPYLFVQEGGTWKFKKSLDEATSVCIRITWGIF
eukprot:Pompholyxophrys_punicea_v1_NODE_1009_length_1043_cov_28.467611.p1 type:complete len:303 gc:universal NODE_1009_length_1043_cov_28.467611:86-994(+)